MKELYMNPCGHDQWLVLLANKKKIKLHDIQSGYIEYVTFLTKKAAKDNFNEWLGKQEIRLPKSFLVKTSKLTDLPRLYMALNKLNIDVPPRSDLTEYILFHKNNDRYIHMVIENFDNPLLPIIDYKHLEKVSRFRTASRTSNPIYAVFNTGIFKESKTI